MDLNIGIPCLTFSVLWHCFTLVSGNQLEVNQSSLYNEQLQCLPGFIYNTTIKSCECYPNSNVQCTDNEAFLYFGNCMTYEEGEGTFLGFCIAFRAHGRNITDRVYLNLPENLTELNEYICGPLNRKGLVCSECIDGFAPAITSLGYQCSNCTDAWYGIPLFLFLEFVPITIFYFIIVAYGFSVTSPPMSSYVLFCQLAAHVFTVFTTLTTVIENEYGISMAYFIRLVTSLCGIWNLDFFRYLIPPFCISPHLKLLHIFFLYYISAFYPLCLIGITWACIELYSRNFRVLTWLCHQTKRCCCPVRRKTDLRSTIIDVFATFFLLSYTKLLYTSLYFLIFLSIEKNGLTYRLVSGLDPSVDYFSKVHAPFAMIALLILIGPVILPVLLLALYPIRMFRSLLEKCRLSGNSRAAVNLFVEKFYNCYRDGLDGGKDMRSFVILPFLLRLTVFVGVLLQGLIAFWFFHFLLFGGASLLVVIVQPYKQAYMNVTDSLILAVLSLIGIIFVLYLFLCADISQSSIFFLIALCLLITLPLLGFIIAVTVKLIRRIVLTSWVKTFTKAFGKPSIKSRARNNEDEQQTQKHVNNNTVIVTRTEEFELPDRVLNPDRYEDNEVY